MIGRLNIEPPDFPDAVRMLVESHRQNMQQDYRAIAMFGLWGTPHASAEARLYAAYACAADAPEDGSLWLEISRIHLECGQYRAAEAVLRELERLGDLGLYPGFLREDLRVHLALVLTAAGRIDNASDLMASLAAEYDDHPLFHYLLASIYHAQQRWSEARLSYDRALAVLAATDPGELGDEIDAEAAAAYIGRQRQGLAAQQPFIGIRPLDLGQLYDD